MEMEGKKITERVKEAKEKEGNILNKIKEELVRKIQEQ